MEFEATIVNASADGVGPAVLLSAPNGAAQYLINAPEGFSRLALEHKIRPSAKLACVLISSIHPHSAGGLGSLLLRLAQDGHGQLQLIGPQGCAAYTHALRHIFRWRHPKVFVSECHRNMNIPIFEDEHVVIVPLMAGDQSYSCPWCVQDYRITTTSIEENSVSTSCQDSAVSLQARRRQQYGTHNLNQENLCNASNLFAELDTIFNLENKSLIGLKSKVLKRLTKDTNLVVDDHSNGSQKPEFKWMINNLHEDELPDLAEESNPVYCRDPSGNLYSTISKNASQTQETSSSSILMGYVCFMKKLNAGVVIVDLQNSADLDNFQAHPVFQCELHALHGVAAMIHLCPASVLQSQRYCSWMDSYAVHHVLVNGGLPQYGFNASLATMAKLNLVDQKVFPLPLCGGEGALSTEAGDVWHCRLLSRVVFESRESDVHVRMDHSNSVDYFKFKQFQETFLQSRPEVKERLLNRDFPDSKAKQRLTPNQFAAAAMKRNLLQRGTSQAPEFLGELKSLTAHVSQSDFELIFLGTGSAEPSKYRGSSGILLQLVGGSAMLLDSGEGVVGQIMRRYGRDRASQVLRSLECLWLSHKHADHVLGAVSVIYSRQMQATPLVVIGSSAVSNWLTEVRNAHATSGYSMPGFEFIHFEEVKLMQKERDSLRLAEKETKFRYILEKLQLRSMVNVAVDHCYEAYGLVLFGQSGWSLVYSGDTRPCERLIQAGAGCTLLIHEATFEDCLENHARKKRHSTVAEALQVGKQMHAEQVILTHFSQRYAKVVEMDTSRYPEACMAFDGMAVRSSSMSCLKDLQPTVNLILAESPQNLECSTYWWQSQYRKRNLLLEENQIATLETKISESKQPVVSKHIRWLDSDSDDG